jgi:hypothetical protein
LKQKLDSKYFKEEALPMNLGGPSKVRKQDSEQNIVPSVDL